MASSFVVPYLLLVSFLTPLLSSPEVTKTKVLNDSPFQGVAVMLRDAYDCQQIQHKDFAASVRLLKLQSRKDIWPWVFFNRFLGYKEDAESHPSIKGQKYADQFKTIKGMDLFNETGALEDFFNVWEISLRVSKELGSPGIVVDPEAYNNYESLNLNYVAEQTGRSIEQIRERLEEIGRELADRADGIHPRATIWFLSTSLGRQRKVSFSQINWVGKKYYATYTHIIIGMLQRAKERAMHLKFICGGEEALGYCHESIETMKEKIKKRQAVLGPFLQTYNNLHMAGTLAPWDKVESKVGYFVTNGECRNSEFKTISDFKPAMKELFTAYEYNWMYAGSSQWNPYDGAASADYNKALEEAITEVRNDIGAARAKSSLGGHRAE
ncbi:MAG: hypothetical protein HY912_17430 [Desulfomonile tiedjei]|uniref:Uncharacterized protein n=1 Tax=Desulfomonile tiedjei TaxID=2358 RepID=A0A9D6V3M8_9BACT|nr:hypothetical protein [Desulfomonile tiedjei]